MKRRCHVSEMSLHKKVIMNNQGQLYKSQGICVMIYFCNNARTGPLPARSQILRCAGNIYHELLSLPN